MTRIPNKLLVFKRQGNVRHYSETRYHLGWGVIREDHPGIGQAPVFKVSAAGSLGALILCFVTSINHLHFCMYIP